MERVRLDIGTAVNLNGRSQDDLRSAEFEAEELGSRTAYLDERGSRGVTETLYCTPGGRFIVYIEDWSHWQGEPTTCRLVEVDCTDLDVGGPFEMLGRACGMGRPLTLSEALAACGDEDASS